MINTEENLLSLWHTWVWSYLTTARPLISCCLYSGLNGNNLTFYIIHINFTFALSIFLFLSLALVHFNFYHDPTIMKHTQRYHFASHLNRVCSLDVFQTSAQDLGQILIQLPGAIGVLEWNQLHTKIFSKTFCEKWKRYHRKL